MVDNLAKLVQGPPGLPLDQTFKHPDVEALRLRMLLLCGRPLSSVAPFQSPPMLAAGWRALMDACKVRPDLIPKGSLTAEIAARLLFAEPWVAWKALDRTASSLEALNQAIDFGAVIKRTVVFSLQATAAVRSLDGGSNPPLQGVDPAQVADATDVVDADVPGDFVQQCRIIRAALVHRSLREWYRQALLIGDDAPVATPPAAVGISSQERILASVLRPIASDEQRQRLFDDLLLSTARSGIQAEDTDALFSRTGLPPSTVEEAARTLAEKFLQQAATAQIDLQARSNMAVPDLIIPYDPEFLGDGFVVPAPALTDALRGQAYANAATIDYTHFSLVMHAKRCVAIFAANNIDASRKVRVAGGLAWRMDERVGEFQLGPEVYANNQLDRGHMVRREDVLWGTVAEARQANRSTYFYSNAAPQHQNFNQDEWVTLEDRVLDNATEFSYRLCVFSGPVLRDNDPTLGDLPSNLRAAFSTHGPAQIPAAFWKVIVLRDAQAGGEDLSVVAFAMRQSEMWNDKEGRRLLNLKVHQVTLRAIESWTGLDFGELKQADELEWSTDRAAARAANLEPEWPQIRSGQDIVFSGSTRRARGQRAPRRAAVQSAASPARLGEARTPSDCECAGAGFDARAAIDALSRDIVRLTSMVSAQQPAAAPPAAAVPAGGATRSLAPDQTVTAADAAAEDPRVTLIAASTPASIREKMREFARELAIQADIYRGVRLPAVAQDLKRIIGGDDVPIGGFLSCVCIGNAQGWFCTGV